MTVDPDSLVAYALGNLPPEAEAEVERYLESHPEAREEVRAWQDALSASVLELEPMPLSAGAEQRLLERVRAQETPVRPSSAPVRKAVLWPWLAASAATVALIALLPTIPAYQNYQFQQRVQGYSARPGAVSRPLLDAQGQSVGLVVRLPNGQVFAALNRPPSPERVYQAWRIPAGGTPVSLGVWPRRDFETRQSVPEGQTFAVSLEPPGGSDQPSSAPVAVAQL